MLALPLRITLLATALALAAGCDGELDYTGMEPLQCEWDRPAWLSGVTPAEPAAYVELRTQTGAVEASLGTPCSEATDVEACKAALAAAGSEDEEGFDLGHCIGTEPEAIDEAGCGALNLVVNRGDSIEVLRASEEVRAFLGTLDTPMEAAWAVSLGRFAVDCSPGVRAMGESWEVAAKDRCGSELIVRIGADGATEVVDEIDRDCTPEQGE